MTTDKAEHPEAWTLKQEGKPAEPTDGQCLMDIDDDMDEAQLLETLKMLKSFGCSEFLDEDESEEEEEVDPQTIQDPAERLLYAAEKNHLGVVKEVLDRNPSLISTQDSDGYSALHRASYNNHVDIAKELILRGANVDLRTADNWTPLHSACRWNNTETASLLLHNGADVNAQTKMGLTPLHLAANNQNSRNLLVLLLSCPGVDTTVLSHAGETAHTVAVRSGPHSQLFDTVVGKSF